MIKTPILSTVDPPSPEFVEEVWQTENRRDLSFLAERKNVILHIGLISIGGLTLCARC